MLEIPDSDCMGIDKFDPGNPPESEDIFGDEPFSIDSVQSRFKEVSDGVKSRSVEFQGNALVNDICRVIIDKEKYPVIRKGDLLTGENLSSHLDLYFDLIYCKRVLYNIFLGDNKNPDGSTGVNLAIDHIANALKPNGWFCLVEIESLRQSMDLEDSLKRVGFEFDSPRRVIRPYKTLLEYLAGNHNGTPFPYSIYHCNKTK